MKKIVVLISLMIGFAANSASYYQVQQLVSCRMVTDTPDRQLLVDIYTGGFTGLTQLQIKQVINGKVNNVKNYIVKQLPIVTIPPKKQILEFQGQNISLKINLSSIKITEHRFHSFLEIADGNFAIKQNLVCEFISNTQH